MRRAHDPHVGRDRLDFRRDLGRLFDGDLFGVGLGRFQTVTEAAVRDGTLHEPYRDSDPHSTVFGALAETGVVRCNGQVADDVKSERLARLQAEGYAYLRP